MQNFSLKLHSSLEKLLPHTANNAPTIQHISGLHGETVSFQLSFQCHAEYYDDFFSCVQVKSSVCNPKVFLVEQVPCTLPCLPTSTGEYLTKTPTLMPDPLVPYHGKPLRVKHFLSHILWVDIPIDCNTQSGEIEVLLFDRKGTQVAKESLQLTVVPVTLTPQIANHSEWFYSDCICHQYGCAMFSDRFFEIAANYFRCAAEHSIDTLLTPVFTPSLDIEHGGRRMPSQLVKIFPQATGYRFDFSLLERWVSVAQSCGIRYFEIVPFFTQWGAKCAAEIYWETPEGTQTLFGWDTPADSPEYAAFLKEFLSQLMPVLRKMGIADKTFFHVSDEPSLDHLEQYQKAHKMIAPYVENCPILDALSDPEFYKKGLVSIPVVADDHIDPFLKMERTGPLWTYCCCVQDKLVPNFFISMPSVRGRILGVLMYLEQLDGFLRWGFNFWNSQFSIEPIDPYRVTDSGRGFPSGDAFLVYPANDGSAVASLRLKTMREAFQDKRALETLEQLIGREKTVALIEKHLGTITFSSYPCDLEKLLALRHEINQTIAALNG